MNKDDSFMSLDDQVRINNFSYMVDKKNELIQIISWFLKDIKEIKESFDELDLVLEEELYYMVGSSYVLTNVTKIKEKKELQLKDLEINKKEKEKELMTIKQNIKEEGEMLKKRFGDSINLEE